VITLNAMRVAAAFTARLYPVTDSTVAEPRSARRRGVGAIETAATDRCLRTAP
jgi:hypothetical protein